MSAVIETQPRVTVGVEAGIATITLERPESGNAIGLVFAEQLLYAVLRCERRDVHAVLITSRGRSFCVGGDLREFATFPPEGRREHLRDVTAALHEAVALLAELPVPVVVAARGAVAGAGVSLVCAADLAIVADDTTFMLAYTGVGYTPDGGASWLLPRLVGHRRAMELLLLNRRLGAAEAREWGLVNAVVAAADLDEQALAVARTLARGPRLAQGEAKRLAHASWTRALVPALTDEASTISVCASSEDGVEGVRAFLAKRPPDFGKPPMAVTTRRP